MFAFVYINEWLHVLVQWCISAVFNAEPFICMSEPLGNVAAPAKADVCYLLMFFLYWRGFGRGGFNGAVAGVLCLKT